MASGKYQEWLTDEGLLKIEGWARDGLTDKQIAHNIGVNEATLNRWKTAHAPIMQVLKRGKEVIDREVENALLRRALGYTYEEVTKERIVDTGQNKRHSGVSKLTEEEWEFAQKYFNGKCCYCDEMTEDLTKDHVKPLNEDGTLSFDNVIPACRSCNSSKSDNEIMSWFQSQEFYDKGRMRKINDYLNFVYSLGGQLARDKPEDEELAVTKIVTKHVPPDTTAQIFWLRNRKGVEWSNKDRVDAESVKANTELTRAKTQLIKGAEHDTSMMQTLLDVLKEGGGDG